jgi:hypothetical protein
MIRRDIRTYLKTKTALTDLIGGATTPRLYWSKVPAGDTPLSNYPCVVFRRATGGYGHDMDGSDGKAQPEFEFMSIGLDPEAVEAIAEELRLAMQGFSGMWGTSAIDEVLLDDELDGIETTKVGDDEYDLPWIVQVFQIGHKVAKPTFA